jgi:uncharacterized RmlC-like cupin family protein
METIITRGLPNAVVYNLSDQFQTTITLPPGSTWTSGLHWHETHTEYLRLVKGTIRVQLGNTTSIISADATTEPVEVKVDRFVWHEWSRAVPHGEEVIVIERTDPADHEKHLFFYNLNGVILQAQRMTKPELLPAWLFGLIMDFWVTFNLFLIFCTLDNFPSFLNLPGRLQQRGITLKEESATLRAVRTVEMHISHIVLGTASLVGSMISLQAVKENFTPQELYHDWIISTKKDKGQ